MNYEETIREHHQSGRRVIGYFCSYMPEELFYAAEFIPMRIFPVNKDRFDLADEYFPAYTCSFARASLNELLAERYNQFDGYFFSSNCDTIRCLFHHFKRHCEGKYIPSMNYPAKAFTHAAWMLLKQELKDLKVSIESYTGKIIENQKLADAINVYQENRLLMKTINQVRISFPGLISARAMNSLFRRNTRLEKRQANEMLCRFLNEYKTYQNDAHNNERPKVFVMGNCCGNNEVLELIESCGINTVDDLLASGVKQFHEAEQRDGSDPIGYIASRLNYRLICPTKILAGSKEKSDNMAAIMRQVRASGAEGIILLHQKFCDPHGLDRPHLLADLKKINMPILEIESEQNTLNREQLKTRIEAFVEMIG